MLTVLTGIVGTLAIYFFVAPYSANWFKISAAQHAPARLAFEITAFGIIPTTLTSGLRGALEGLQRFLDSNINRIALGTLMFVMPALVVYIRGPDLPAVALSLVAARLLVCGLALFQLRQYLRRSVPIRSDDIKPLLNFGVWVTISREFKFEVQL